MDDCVYTVSDLKKMQAWSLQKKIQVTQHKIIEWLRENSGKAYISFSGGKDSLVLLDLARRIDKNIPAVFADTGLEFPEVRKFALSKDNVERISPEMRFDEVIKRYGWCFPSKEIARNVWYAKTMRSGWAIKNFKGVNKAGEKKKYKERYKKWRYLLYLDDIISSECCNIMKIKPFLKYEKQTGNKPVVATMASESHTRKLTWLRQGCNAFDVVRPMSRPMSFWTDNDVIHYLELTELNYPSVYGNININNGVYSFTGYKRTGCMFCPVGCHLQHPNQFEQLKITHPKQYDYCMRPIEENGLGLKQFLDNVGIENY